MQPASWYAFSWRVRLTTCATGTRAAAPAEVFHADGVMPAARRSGISDAVRAEAGRRPDDGTEVARVGDRVERDDQRLLAALGGEVEQVVGVGVLVRPAPARPDPGAPRRRSSGRARPAAPRAARRRGRRRAGRSRAAGRRARRPRRRTPRSPACSARSASTTELRPAIHSASPGFAARFGRVGRRPARRARWPCRPCGWGGPSPSASGPCPRGRA